MRSKKTKFMMSLDPRILKQLKPHLDGTGVIVQELIRARIIPQWIDGLSKTYQKGYALGYKAGLKKSKKYLKNGSSRKVLGNGSLSKTA